MGASQVRALSTFVVAAVTTYVTRATERHVSGEYATIQEASFAWTDSYTVVVAYGTHTGVFNRALKCYVPVSAGVPRSAAVHGVSARGGQICARYHTLLL